MRSRGASSPGSGEFEAIRREIWDDNNLGNAIPGATPSARIDVRTLVPGLPVIAPRRRAVARPDAGPQSLDARLPGARHATAAAWSGWERSSARPRAR